MRTNKINFSSAFADLVRTAGYMGSMRKVYVLGLLLSLSEMAALFAIPVLNRQLVLLVTGKAEQNTFLFSVVIFIVLLALVPVIALGKYLQGISGAHGIKELRRSVFAHIQKLSLSDAGERKVGDMITRLTNDTERTGVVFQSFAMVSLVRFVSVIPVSAALLLIADWRIALLGLLYNGVCFFLAAKLNPYVRKLERGAREDISESANYLLEAVRAGNIIRVFRLSEILRRKYEHICRRIMAKRIKFRFMNGLSYGIIDLFVFSAQGLAFLLGLSFNLSAGEELAACVYAASLMGVMSNATLSGSSFLLLIQPSLAAAARVFEILDKKTEADRLDAAKPDLSHQSAVEVQNLSFSYPDGTKALDAVDLKIKRGERVALVGASGSGKSTLMKLLGALYEPGGGSIVFFGAPAERLSLGAIRALSSYVPQECTVFDDSIGANIGYGRIGASQEEITASAKAAGIHDYIKTLPAGYETVVGEQGSQISGGERQRLAIARAVLKQAPLLLLDEVTSSLDSTKESEIYKNLDSLINGAATITIAHRLSAVRNADRIIVFNKGCIVEEGNHDALMDLGGYYKELYAAQNGQG
jgi:ABC-type multidrug transport system fused ATPase/permease subunit